MYVKIMSCILTEYGSMGPWKHTIRVRIVLPLRGVTQYCQGSERGWVGWREGEQEGRWAGGRERMSRRKKVTEEGSSRERY